MRKILQIFIPFILLFFAEYSNAQDMHFTQFYATPLYLNPAFTGANVCTRISLTYRNQWPSISKGYKTYMVGGDHFLSKQNIGVGLLVANDEAGSASLKTNLINPSVAYEMDLNRTQSLRFGLQPGICIKSVDYSRFLFGDQIARGGTVPTVENMQVKSKVFLDMNAGALLYASKYYLGVSFFHLNRPNESLLGGKSVLPMKFTVHGGYTMTITEANSRNLSKQNSMSFAFHLRGQNKFDQLDLAAYYNQYLFTVGLWYRGIPLIKAYKPGYSNNDAIAAIVGYKKDGLSIGYSYDFTISKLFNLTNGASEVTVGYQFCPPRKKIKPRRRIACAKF